MKLLKKSVFWISIPLILVISYIFYYGAISPISDITGCYVYETESFMDKICLYDTGSFEQFFSISGGVEEKYNKSSWTNFTYTSDEGEFIAGTLKGFIRRDSEVSIKSIHELDIQPHKDIFGKIVFAIGGNETRERRVYLRHKAGHLTEDI